MLNIKCIPRKALVLVLGGGMLLPNISPAMINDTAGCPVHFERLLNSTVPAHIDNTLFITSRPDTDIGSRMTVEVYDMNSGETYSVQASRHHIIPHATLRDFYNRVIERAPDHQNELREFTSALSNLIDNADRYYLNFLHPMERIDNERELRYARTALNRLVNTWTHQREFTVTSEDDIGLRLIQSIYIWMPGNIFLGPAPSERADDPGSNFDEEAIHIIGRENYNILHTIYLLMRAYVAGENRLNDGSEVTMTRIVSLLNQVPSSIFLSNEDNWIKDIDETRVGITWNDELEVENVTSIHNKIEKRGTKSNFILRKLSSIPDAYCLMTPKIVKKKLVASLLTHINPDLNTNKEPGRDELR
uniref:Putative Shiga-like toxin alpha subunit n=1 Tax=Bacteriophage APSE-4 TaxID=568990 RepID=A0A076JGD5_9VIRU|nr:putative Shiga-like toxin alpha subunit [Bacteriophage APSE-4]